MVEDNPWGGICAIKTDKTTEPQRSRRQTKDFYKEARKPGKRKGENYAHASVPAFLASLLICLFRVLRDSVVKNLCELERN